MAAPGRRPDRGADRRNGAVVTWQETGPGYRRQRPAPPGPRPAHRPAATLRRSSLVLALFALYIVGAHLRLSIYAGTAIVVPMYLMLFSAAIATLLFLDELIARMGGELLLIALLLLALPVLGGAPGNDFRNTLTGTLQLFASIVAAMAFACALRTLAPARTRRLILWLFAGLIALSLLETAGLKPAIDALRDALYSGSGRHVYEATQRDIAIYGRVRATALASEPSFLADTICFLALASFFLDPARGRPASWLRLLGLMSLGALASPSFKMVFYLLGAAIWQLWPGTLRGALGLIAGLGVGAGLAFLFRTPLIGLLLAGAGDHLVSGSFYGRIGVAHTVGLEALRRQPLFGFGPSNDAGLHPILLQVWQDSGAFALFPWYLGRPAPELMSNGFWWAWCFLGLAGGAMFFTLVARLLRKAGTAHPWRCLLCTWVVWYAGAAFVDPRSWSVVLLFALDATRSRTAP